MSAPFEQKPGGSTGLTTGTMTPQEWQEYSRRVDPGGVDPTWRNMGLNQRAVTTDATGAWQEGKRAPEYNPADISQPMIDFQGSAAKREINPGTRAGIEAGLATRGLTDFQIGSPATLWDTRAGNAAKNSIKIDLGRGVTEDEARKLHTLGQQHGLSFANTGTGAGFMNFNDEMKGGKVQKLLDVGLAKAINDIVPGAAVSRAAATGDTRSIYVNYGQRKANEGKGYATRMLDEKLQAAERSGAPGMVSSLLDDPNEAVKAQQNLQRLQASGQIGVRPDYERYLRLLAETRLRGLMEHARSVGYRGLPAVGAGAALGGGLLGGDGSREPPA
jgi:hypothetical protein